LKAISPEVELEGWGDNAFKVTFGNINFDF
jgi:hypothetical protein